MQNLFENLQEVDNAIDKLKESQAFAKTFDTLYKSDAFRVVFRDALLKDRVEYLTNMITKPELSVNEEKYILDELRSIRYLNTFIQNNLGRYENLTRDIAESEIYRDNLAKGSN